MDKKVVMLPRRLLMVALVGLLLACLALPWLGGQAMREAALAGLASRELDDLALLAAVRDDQGTLLRDEPFPVEVVQDGGSLWITPAVERAVDESEWFATGNSPHILRVEVIEDPRALALQLHLWRAGWELRSPEPLRVRTTPWMLVIAGLLGAATAVLVRRVSLGLALAGVLAQLLLGTITAPAELFPPQTTWAEWQAGPLFGRVLPWIEAMTPVDLGIAAAVISLCLVLVAFDHRRSKSVDAGLDLGSAGLLALLGTLGLLGLIEALFRSGFAASLAAWPGWLALIGVLLAWVPALALAREAWLRQRRASKQSTGGIAPPVRESVAADAPD
ncbi:hypothetical protein ACNOYE_27150 [Nannocystaceae bacterium ST9]